MLILIIEGGKHMAVIGAILGDISGSQYEFEKPKGLNYKTCKLFTENCRFTDDTVMTLAVKMAVKNQISFEECYKIFWNKYPNAGYGKMFNSWAKNGKAKPYNSFGNGSAMRCSYIGEHFRAEEDVKRWAKKSAECTHSHPEGIKGAVATSMCVYMAGTGASKDEIFNYIKTQYPKDFYKYSVEYELNKYRDTYRWDVTCQGSVPVSVRCFLESEDYETFIRNVYSLSCDMDTLCAIGGGIAEEFYHGTGFHEDKILEKYLDGVLYEIAKR